jgi:hypothetical protein
MKYVDSPASFAGSIPNIRGEASRRSSALISMESSGGRRART